MAALKRAIFLLFLLLAVTSAPAQDATAPADPATKQLADRFSALMKLFTSRETEKILAEFQSPFQMTFPTGHLATDHDSLEKYFSDIYKKDVGLLQRIEIDPDDVKVTLVGENDALITATGDDKFISREGYEYKLETRWTGTARRTGAEWKFVTLSHTANVLKNPMMKEAVDASRLRPLVAGIAGLLVGLLGGWGFWTLRSSRR